MAKSGKIVGSGIDIPVENVEVVIYQTPGAEERIRALRETLRQRSQTTLSEMDRMPVGAPVTLTMAGIKQGFDWQGRITGKVIGWRKGRVKVLKDGLLRPQFYDPKFWRPIPPDAQIFADWLEERGHSQAAADFRAHWCP